MSYFKNLPIELIDKVFECIVEVTPDYRFPGGFYRIQVLTKATRRDLLSCSLSCSVFFGPAMRILWSTSELPWIIKLLPGLDIADGSHVNPLYLCCQLVLMSSLQILTGELNEDALKRFDFYSSMVKTLLHYSWETWEKDAFLVDKSVYASLALIRPRPFPSLTHLSTKVFTEETMFLLEAPMLQSLSILNEDSIGKYLLSISSFNFLRSFDLTLFRSPRSGTLDLSPFHRLQQLEVLGINLMGISVSPSTTSSESSNGSLSTFALAPKALKQLRLVLSSYSASVAPALQELYRESPLEVFTLCMDVEKQQCKTIFSAMPSLWLTTLTTLDFDFANDLALPPTHTRDTLSKFIEPLYALRALQKVAINFISSYDANVGYDVRRIYYYLTDIDLNNICDAWPNLTQLILGIEPQPGHSGRVPTVSSLPVLSRKCPKLETLEIPFDICCHVPPIDQTTARLPRNPHRLAHLILRDDDDFRMRNERDRPAMLVSHLDMAFPFLKEVELLPVMNGAWDPDAWDAVNAILKDCQVRRQCEVEL
ncbi:hypothetical protein D9758_005135 [Tetrapyrgos nigripes]|uniref:Uncharacterized protein n=1 Tax=Tetrapyrgos nigripes TaxID=182062 RepID=A0A8H5LX08_9AGAR|nr:hypothetical protein D9758_005135 [Tetrapyrgos nigripes]